MKNKYYITTPLYYVNSKPHLGTLYSTVIADVLARWQKICGKEVFFLTGTDEHGQKVAEKAHEQGKSPKDFADMIVPQFKDMWKLYGVEYDKFIRTTDQEHKDAVVSWLKLMHDNGDIYKADYTGWYCVPCESFVNTSTDDGSVPTCPTCSRELQELSQESYFFRLSAYEDQLLKFYEDHPRFVVPKERLNEVISFVKSGLKDLSISRKGLEWGIPFPLDESHSVYVWADALNNYISAIGYASTDEQRKQQFEKLWPADVQVMAKDIVRFHAVYWPAFLMAAGLPLPKKLLVHGYILSDDQKMSKSLGNVIDPEQLVADFGVDQVRYYLMRHMAITHDCHFNINSMAQHIGAELANELGNLLQRTTTLAEKNNLSTVPPIATLETATAALHERCEEAFRSFWDEMEHCQIHLALNAVWKYINAVNAYFHEQKPWVLAKQNEELFAEVISASCHSLRAIAYMLWPIMPSKMETLLKSLGTPFEPNTNYETILRKNEWNMTFDIKKPEEPLFVRPEVQKEKPDKQSKPAKQAFEMIEIGDFAKVQLWVGQIVACKPMEGSDKLLRMKVDMGPHGQRTILAGVAKVFSPDDLIGKKGIYVGNLKPRKMMGTESQGMMLFAKDDQGNMRMATVDGDVVNGTRLM